MTKPDVLQMMPITPNIQAQADAAFALQKLWQAADGPVFIEEVAPGVRAVLTNGIIGAERALIEALPKLEIIGVYGVGVDAVDLAAAKARGVRVTNTPDVLTIGVAELGMALLLDLARRVAYNDRYVRAGRWPTDGDPVLSNSIAGKRMGILGLGRIGRAVARRAEAFDMTICYHGRSRRDDVAYEYVPDLVAMARAVDCLMVTCLGGPTTAGLVSREVIDALGPKGWLINVARGSVVDQPALVEALVEGRLGGAGLDVFAGEPEVPDALLGLDNVVLQPHQASATWETRDAMGQLVVDNLKAHFAGRPLPTPVL
ncbi:MAG TPA: 2-hydroxyacid dehydrogenase [Geminicoccaceae bacterium]|nr:2-hydroxyacid dehydrogenase [Geminicoccaceae bacterium]